MKQSSSKNEVNYVKVINCNNNVKKKEGTIVTEQFIMIILFNRIRLFIETYKLLKAADSQVLSTLVLNVTLPSLVIVNLNSAELDFSFSILPIMMIVYGVLAKFTVLWLFNKHNNHIKGTVGMMTASLNIGLFAYPLVDTIWPKME